MNEQILYNIAVLCFTLIILTHIFLLFSMTVHSIINLLAILFLIYYFSKVKNCYAIPFTETSTLKF